MGVMNTLFALEDLYGLKIDEINGDPVIRINKNSQKYPKMVELFRAWQKEAQKWRDGEISKDDYDHWRYSFSSDNR